MRPPDSFRSHSWVRLRPAPAVPLLSWLPLLTQVPRGDWRTRQPQGRYSVRRELKGHADITVARCRRRMRLPTISAASHGDRRWLLVGSARCGRGRCVCVRPDLAVVPAVRRNGEFGQMLAVQAAEPRPATVARSSLPRSCSLPSAAEGGLGARARVQPAGDGRPTPAAGESRLWSTHKGGDTVRGDTRTAGVAAISGMGAWPQLRPHMASLIPRWISQTFTG